MASERTRAERTPSLEAAYVARRFYLDNKQKSEIADELGISRFRVARLIDEARASGIVHISVDVPTELDIDLGDELVQRFGLRRAVVARVLEDDQGFGLAVVAAAAARQLASLLSPTDVLGLSWGRALTTMADVFDRATGTDVVQLVGGLNAAAAMVGGAELVRRMAERTGGRAFPLHAPLIVQSSVVAKQLLDDPSLSSTTSRYADLTIAAVGIGSWESTDSAVIRELAPADVAELRALAVAADLCGFIITSEGECVSSEVANRRIGISLEEFRRIPEVIAVAGGRPKVAAIRASLLSGLISTLVTDATTAQLLLG